MNGTQILATTLRLPPIPLSELPERTKDYLLAESVEKGCSPMQALKDTLDRAAARAGFKARTKQQPPAEGTAG